MKLEIDEISGDYIIRLSEDQIYELEWEEGDHLDLNIYKDRSGSPYLHVDLK